ncbi:hypothetical protein Goshw_011016 [Gossypium schwendimanii]|uniref:Uncharacterized protein n=1 Tax=Gossypium schwendimanii TaxID=34291 RepID=A0A7J9KX36_GOSSC|nr:hypothetical protein [Gossypium schwendimanii]
MHDNHRSCIVVSVCWIKISGGTSCYTIYGGGLTAGRQPYSPFSYLPPFPLPFTLSFSHLPLNPLPFLFLFFDKITWSLPLPRGFQPPERWRRDPQLPCAPLTFCLEGLCMVMSIELLWISVFRMLMSSERLRIYSSRWPRRALRCQW